MGVGPGRGQKERRGSGGNVEVGPEEQSLMEVERMHIVVADVCEQ